MLNLVRSISFLLFFSLTNYCLGQEIITHYTVEDGLPSNEVYYVYQDFDGYMWFCTDRGVSRYNGYEFKNFTTHDGLTYDVVFKIFEDEYHNLWFTCFDGSVCIWDHQDHCFKPFSKNKELEAHNGAMIWAETINVTDDSIFFYPINRRVESTVYVVSEDTLIRHAAANEGFVSNSKYPNSSLQSVIYSTPSMFFTVRLKYDRLKPFSKNAINEIFQEFYLNDVDELAGSLNQRWVYSLNYFKGIIAVGKRNGLYIYEGGKLRSTHLLGNSVSSTELDNEHKLWVSTLSKGVYVLGGEGIKKYDCSTFIEEGEKITELVAVEDHIIVGTSNGKVLEVGDIIEVYDGIQTNEWIHFFSKVNDELSFYQEGQQIIIDTKKKLKRGVVEPYPSLCGHAYNLLLNLPNNGSFIIGSGEYLYCEDGQLLYHKKGRLLYACLDNDNSIYYSTNFDLFKVSNFDFDNPISLTEQFELENSIVRKMYCTEDSLLILATSGDGVIIAKDDRLKVKINNENGLPSNSINCCYIDSEKRRLWCGTNRGLSIIDYNLEGDGFNIEGFTNLNKMGGLASNYITEITHTKDKVWLGLNQSVVSIPKDFQLKEIVPPQMNFVAFVNNDSNYSIKQIPEFKHSENNIEIRYEAMSLLRPVNGEFYRYRLINEENPDSIWHHTNDRGVWFKNLVAGSYLFQVEAKSENSTWSSPKNIQFEITPYFFDRHSVKIGGIVLLILILAFFQNRYLLSLKRKNQKMIAFKNLQLENQKLALESLRGQMNPHFIFNALKSVQRHILKDGKWAANDLLGRFSKLIRASLEYSRSEFISVGKEVDFLGNYLEIEQLRIPEKFNYEIILEKPEELEGLLIPPLLIQPICENAVKHAFGKEDGLLTIRIKLIEVDQLLVEVSDNGIGYLNARKRQSVSQHSMGLDIVRSRIELFEKQGYNVGIKLEPLDKVTTKGTKVILRLPCK